MWLKYLIEAIKDNDDQQILQITEVIITQAFNETEINGSTALHWVAWYGHVQATQMLINARPEIAKLLDNDGFSALHYAALNGSVKTIEILLKFKPELSNMVTNGGSTALKAACWGEHWEASKLLHSYQNTIKNEDILEIAAQLDHSDQDKSNSSKIELIASEAGHIEI